MAPILFFYFLRVAQIILLLRKLLFIVINIFIYFWNLNFRILFILRDFKFLGLFFCTLVDFRSEVLAILQQLLLSLLLHQILFLIYNFPLTVELFLRIRIWISLPLHFKICEYLRFEAQFFLEFLLLFNFVLLDEPFFLFFINHGLLMKPRAYELSSLWRNSVLGFVKGPVPDYTNLFIMIWPFGLKAILVDSLGGKSIVDFIVSVFVLAVLFLVLLNKILVPFSHVPSKQFLVILV